MGQRVPLVTGQFYHLYNRGVDRRTLFYDEHDYLHFVHCLYAFNDRNPSIDSRNTIQRTDLRIRRDPIVNIVAWCLMPNHFHLLLEQHVDGGISLFLKKLGTGYALTFNERHERSGTLFQGRYQSKHVHTDAYLQHLVRYIHLNPVDLFSSGWKERSVDDRTGLQTQLRDYRWSSYRDWIGEKNFPSILHHETITRVIPREVSEGHEGFVWEWAPVHDTEPIRDLFFEE